MQEEHLHPNQRALSFFTDHFELFCVQLVNSDEPANENSLGRLLLSATYLNDLGTVTAVLKVDLTLLKDYGHLAAIIAAGMGYYDLVKLLHESHPEWFNSSLLLSSHFLCPFEFAAIRQHQKIIEFLLPHTTQDMLNRPSFKTSAGVIDPLLVNLVQLHRIAILKLILTLKPDLEIRAGYDHTALSFACARGNYESACLLIDAGAEVNVIVKRPPIFIEPINPLNLINGRENAMSEQVTGLTNGQVACLATESIITPLHSAAATGDPRLVYRLLQAGAKTDVVNSMYGTPLALAAGSLTLDNALSIIPDYPNVVRLLLKYNADVNLAKSFDNESPLHAATDNDNSDPSKKQLLESQIDIVKQLLQAGANPYAQNKLGVDVQPKLKVLGISPNPQTSAQPIKTARIVQLQKTLENQKRDDLEKQLSSGKYQPPKPAQPTLLSAAKTTPVSQPEPSPPAVKNKKKKKKKTTAILPNHSDAVTHVDTIPAPVFKPDIPTGDTLQKFPLRLEGVNLVQYYLTLIPNVFNAMFDSERGAVLNILWAAIKTERMLLPSSSKKTFAGIKCLSAAERQELQKLNKITFFDATHRVKPKQDVCRVYLAAKIAQAESTAEIHLEVIGPEFK